MPRHWLKLSSCVSPFPHIFWVLWMYCFLPSPFTVWNLAFVSISILISLSEVTRHLWLFDDQLPKYFTSLPEVFKTIVRAFCLETLQFHGACMFLIFYLTISSLTLLLLPCPSLEIDPKSLFFLLFCPLEILSFDSFSQHLSAYDYYIYICSRSLFEISDICL